MQCLSVAIQEKDRGTEGRMYCNMGNCLRAIIELEKAKECYDRVSYVCIHTYSYPIQKVKAYNIFLIVANSHTISNTQGGKAMESSVLHK